MNTSHFQYHDFVETGDRLARQLRQEGAQLIVALTHMRVPNDQRLASETKEIDLILGGHDHFYRTETINNVLLVKSGSDFRWLSKISVTLTPGNKPKFQLETITCTSDKPEDDAVKKIIADFEDKLGLKLCTQISYSLNPLEGRFSHIRSRETNLANFVTDVMRSTYKTDLALINGGCLRSDTVTKEGPFLLSDLFDILPTENVASVIRLTGEKIFAAIENGVSRLPTLEGRFLHISGGKYTFDPRLEPGKRVLSVYVGDQPIVKDKLYTLATNYYLAAGNEGFHMLAGNEVIVDDEQGQVFRILLRNYFKKLGAAQLWQQHGKRGIVLRALTKMRNKPSIDRFFSADYEGRITFLGPEFVNIGTDE